MVDNDFNIAAVVLAAGKSKRMGEPKMTLPFGKGTMVGAVVDTVSHACGCISSVTVVLGYHGDAVREALADFHVNFAINRKPDMGMLCSVKAGLKGAGEADAYLICLGDQPQICPDAINELIECAKQTDKGLIIPTHEGKRGHPILIRAKYVEEIINLPLTYGLNEILNRHPDDVMEMPFGKPCVTMDIDTPEDYERLRA